MFDFKEWLKNGLIDGYKDGNFSMPHVTTMTANYISKGMLTVEDAATIDSACKEWDKKKAQEEAEAQKPVTLPEFPADNKEEK